MHYIELKKYIMSINLDIDLVITGGLRVSPDFAKAIAMGADAVVAIGSSAMMAQLLVSISYL